VQRAKKGSSQGWMDSRKIYGKDKDNGMSGIEGLK